MFSEEDHVCHDKLMKLVTSDTALSEFSKELAGDDHVTFTPFFSECKAVYQFVSCVYFCILLAFIIYKCTKIWYHKNQW
jgi:hypothetical protein